MELISLPDPIDRLNFYQRTIDKQSFTAYAKCHALEDAVRAALTELGMDAPIDHVTDFTQIAAYGVMTTPAVVLDGKVVYYGKFLKKEEAKAIFQKLSDDTV